MPNILKWACRKKEQGRKTDFSKLHTGTTYSCWFVCLYVYIYKYVNTYIENMISSILF